MNLVSSWLIKKLGNKFSAATSQELIVYGARRPGFPLHSVPQLFVDEWVTFMLAQGIERVVCLLPQKQLAYYDNLLDTYRQTFGAEKVCWTPIEDFHLADADCLTEGLLPFLASVNQNKEKTVVHCSGGVGRTGHVLAAWLVSFKGMSNSAAIEAIKQSGRNARESGDKKLDELLDKCRNKFVTETEAANIER